MSAKLESFQSSINLSLEIIKRKKVDTNDLEVEIGVILAEAQLEGIDIDLLDTGVYRFEENTKEECKLIVKNYERYWKEKRSQMVKDHKRRRNNDNN